MVGICSTNPALTHECTVVIKVTELGACTRCQVHHNIPSCWPRHSDLPLRQRRGAEVEGLQAGVPLVFYQEAHTGSAVCWRVKWAQAEHTEQQLMQPDPIGVPSIFGTPACFAADKLHIWPGCEEWRQSVSFPSGEALSWWVCSKAGDVGAVSH